MAKPHRAPAPRAAYNRQMEMGTEAVGRGRRRGRTRAAQAARPSRSYLWTRVHYGPLNGVSTLFRMFNQVPLLWEVLLRRS